MFSLERVIRKGRLDSYVSKTDTFNPYQKDNEYDWRYEARYGFFTYCDRYSGNNPYNGLEEVFDRKGKRVWVFEYLGTAHESYASEAYDLLKAGRRDGGELFEQGEWRYQWQKEQLKDSILEREECFYGDKQILMQVGNGYVPDE